MAGGDLNFKELQANISAALVETTRTVGQIVREDLAFHRSSNPSVGPVLDRQASRLLNLAQGLLKIATVGTEVPTPQIQDADAVEENWGGVVDVVDNLLEKTDACLDEYTGVIKRSTPGEDTRANGNDKSKKQSFHQISITPHTAKPQNSFLRAPNNNEKTPFKPLLRSKPHAVLPLAQSLIRVTGDDGMERYPNPYEHEITGLRYPDAVYTKSDPIDFPPFTSTQAILVDTPEAVTAMLEDLRLATEIAIDLEHHDTHSYTGLVCLMQISTRDKDWIVDTLKPWREDLQVLNEVFADPNVVKVLHGAFMDIIWLQRDLGLYVVGLFDTFHASRTLGYPRNSLAALLKKFVNFDADKKYQMADWRIRPLPDQMFDYARSDTHFLLFIYDHLRNELLEKSNLSVEDGDLIAEVLTKSKREALQRYERSFYDAERGQGSGGWYNMLNRTPALFSKEQFAVFRAVHQWRDRIARNEDEGSAQIMAKHVLYNIARDLPMDMPSLLGCSHPISPTLRVRTGELLRVIKEARLAGINGPEMKDFMEPISTDLPGETGYASAIRRDPIKNTASETVHQIPVLASLKSTVSRFWGSILDEVPYIHQKNEAQKRFKGLRLALPLPQLTAEVFESKVSTESPRQDQEPIDSGARAEHRYTAERKQKDTNVFVVKQLGGSRKRKADDMEINAEIISTPTIEGAGVLDGSQADQEHSNSSSVMADKENQVNLDDVGTRPLQSSHKLSKGQRKRARKRAEAQRMKEVGREAGDPKAEAFDYAAAPSVLHSKKNKADRPETKQPYNPYTKSLDAPKGVRKFKKDLGGKSSTFKK